MRDMDSVFAGQIDQDTEFDTIFGSQEDGDLVDIACGFNEAGECETDFDELHQTADDADADDIEDEVVGDETDNAPSGAEGTDADPNIDLALGEDADPEFSANGQCISKSDAKYGGDFYPDDIRDEEEQDALTGEGRDVNMDERDIEGEIDKVIESVLGEDSNDSDEWNELHQDDYNADPSDIEDDIFGAVTDNAPKGAEGTDSDPNIDLALGEDCDCDSSDDDSSDDDDLGSDDSDSSDDDGLDMGDDMDSAMDNLDSEDECNESSFFESELDQEDYEDLYDDDGESDSDLIDLVAGNLH